MQYEPPEITAIQGEEKEFNFNLFELLEPILKNIWAFILIVIGFIILGAIFNAKATKVYQASSSIIIRSNTPTDTFRTQETNLPNLIKYNDFHTKIEMISSKPLLEELVRRLIDKGWYQEFLINSKFDEKSPAEQEEIISALASGIKGGIAVQVPKFTNLAKISFANSNKVFARDVVNLLAEVTVAYTQKEDLMMREESLLSLEAQLQEAKNKLYDAEEALYEYRKSNDIFDFSSDKDRISDLRKSITINLNIEKNRETSLEAQITQINNLIERKDFTRYTPILADENLREINTDLVEAIVQYDSIMSIFDEKYPEAIALESKINSLKKSFLNQLVVLRTSKEFELNVTRASIKNMESEFEKLEKSAIFSTEKDKEYLVLSRERNFAETNYSKMLEAKKEVSINNNSVINNLVYVHERATTPKFPIRPKKSLNYLLALASGLMFGFAYAYGREYLDQTIRHADDVRKASGLPVLSVVPLYVPENQKEEKQLSTPLLLTRHPKSLFSEAVTGLRNQLNVKMPQEAPITLLITSSAPREGKSVLSANLAISMGLESKRTLLIDADLHRPSIHKIFGYEKGKGLFDVIVEALNPRLQDLDMNKVSFGDCQHLLKIKQWSGTMNIAWDSLPSTLNISYIDGVPAGSNLQSWKKEYFKPDGFPSPAKLRITLNDSEISDLTEEESSGKHAVEFLHQYPRLVKSNLLADSIINNYARPSDFKNLDVMTAGTSPRNTAEILGSEQMQILFSILKERYDRIIVDTPPSWPLSDVSILGPKTDGILWVCRSGKIPKTVFHRNVQQILQVQPKILGVVLNAVDYKKDRYYYYGYYGYYYRPYRYSYYHNYYSREGE